MARNCRKRPLSLFATYTRGLSLCRRRKRDRKDRNFAIKPHVAENNPNRYTASQELFHSTGRNGKSASKFAKKTEILNLKVGKANNAGNSPYKSSLPGHH